MENNRIIRTDQNNEHFRNLVSELDKDLWDRNEENQSVYTTFNNLDLTNNATVLFENEMPVGCGCFKKYDDKTIEIKRMYVRLDKRGKGYSKQILIELENWAKETGNTYSILETGKKQIEAVGLYKKSGYEIIENYPPYSDMPNSLCFKKML